MLDASGTSCGAQPDPCLFDFDVPADRNVSETVTLLARMARFVIADLTDPKSIPMELEAIAPQVAVPIQSIIHERQEPFSMFTSLNNYHWVLSPYEYGDLDELLPKLGTAVVAPALQRRRELLARRAEIISTRSLSDFDLDPA